MMLTTIFSLRRKTTKHFETRDSFDNFNNTGLAKRLERHELLEFRLAAHLCNVCFFFLSASLVVYDL